MLIGSFKDGVEEPELVDDEGEDGDEPLIGGNSDEEDDSDTSDENERRSS